jgi:UDP:flavonoid glycosyltransferase YjiC (YdhE family)
MRVMFLSTPYPTHFTPVLPLAWALQSAGHDVLVAAQPDVTTFCTSVGLRTAVVGDPFRGLDLLLSRMPEGTRVIEVLGTPTPENEGMAGGDFWSNHARYHLAGFMRIAKTWKPDLLISEQMEYAGRIVAAAIGATSVTHRWGVDALSRPAEARSRRLMIGDCKRYGLDEFPQPDLVVDPCPPSLLHPDSDPGAPIRHVSFNGTGRAPEWLLRPTTLRKRVSVCVGTHTLVLNGLRLVRSIVDSFAELPDVEAIVTIDRDYHERLGPVADNVKVLAPTPINAFLDTCDLVLNHGGANTMMTATGWGIPQVVLPQLADQFAIARRLVAAGAAIAVETAEEQNDPATVRAAVRTVLDDPSYLAAALALKDEMDAMPSPTAVVRDLEELVAAH